jgi:hypothetical protein
VLRFLIFPGRTLLLAFALFTASLALHAQADRGAITGKVTDGTGAIIPGASVTLTSETTGVKANATANASGDFNFQGLIAGMYQLEVDSQGFKHAQISHIVVDVSATKEADVAMQSGDVHEVVEVREQVQTLSTTSGSLGLVVEQRSIQELPLIYGNPFSLEVLSPGVSPSSVNPNIHTYDSTSASVSVNGSALNSLEYRLDGAPNNRIRLSAYTPSTEFINQYRMETSSYDATEGHSAGGFVNVALKSGANAFHAGAFAYYQNPGLNANPWSLTNVTSKPMWLRVGGTVSGPIVRNKAFFFAGYEHSRQASPNPQTLTVPTVAQHSGDFSALYALDPAHPAGTTNTYQLYNPASGTVGTGGVVTRTPITGNKITNISPIAQAILKYYPLPNTAGNAAGGNNFSYAGSEPDYYYSIATRVDYNLNSRQSFFGRYVDSHRLQSKTNAYFLPVSGTTLTYANQGVALGYTFVASAATVIDARLTWTRFVNTNIVNSQGLLDATSIGMPNYLVQGMGSAASSFPNIAPTGVQALADKSNIDSHDDVTMGSVQASHLLRNHFFRFGGEYRMYNTNGGSGAGNNGAYASTGNYVTANSNVTPQTTGFGLAQLETGILSTAKLTLNSDYALRSNWAGIYVMDDWKVNPRLTINMGLRYEYEGPNSERHDKANTFFDFTAVNPIAAAAQAKYATIAPTNTSLPPASAFAVNGGLRFAGEPGSGHGSYNARARSFMPRIGLSYQPEQNTVVRAGFGTFYDSIATFYLSGGNSGSTNNATLTPQQGFTSTTSVTGSGDNGATFTSTLANPFPTGFTLPTGNALGLQTFVGQAVTFQPQNPAVPYNMRWSLGIQHQFGSWLAAIDYVGNRGVHLPVQKEFDAVPQQYLSTNTSGYDKATFNTLNASVNNPFNGIIPATASLGSSKTTVAQLLRPYPEFTSVTAYIDNGSSIYHSIQGQLNRRFSSGVSLTNAFTWSKVLDATQYLNTSDSRLWYGISQNDRTFRYALSTIYELPFGKGRRFAAESGLISKAIGGWQIQAVYQVQSGQPLNFAPSTTTSPLYNGNNPADSAWGKTGYKRSIPGGGQAGTWFDTANWVRTTAAPASCASICSGVVPNAYQIRTLPIRFTRLRADFLNQFDAGVQRNFAVYKEAQLQLRVEAINFLNHPVYTAPNTDWTSSAFGSITTQANQSRVYQFGAFLRF